MSNSSQIPIKVNVATGAIVDPVDGSPLTQSALLPAFFYQSQQVLCVSFVDGDMNPYPLNATDLFECSLDNDFIHSSEGVSDPLMAASGNEQVDIEGDWSGISRAEGRISIRLNCNTTGFQAKIGSSASIEGLLEIKRTLQGSSFSSVMLQSKAVCKNVVNPNGDPAEEEQSNFYSKSVSDARYSQIGHAHAASEVSGLDAAVSANADVAANSSARHSHANKATLDAMPAFGTGTSRFLREDGSFASASVENSTCNIRLTLTSGTPVTASDVTAATTLYATPYKGNRIALYDSSAGWHSATLSERSLSLSGLAASTNHDIYLYNSGTVASPALALQAVAWTDSSTRATALALQDGVYCKSGALGYRYLGTIRTTATAGQTEDSVAKRFVWNFHNRVQTVNFTRDTTDSWTYNGNGTWRQANNGNAAWKHEFVCGAAGDQLFGTASISAINNNSSSPSLTMGYDTSSTPNTAISGMAFNQSSTSYLPIIVQLSTCPAAGYHYVTTMETTSYTGSATFLGDNGGSVGGGNVGAQSYMTTQFWR